MRAVAKKSPVRLSKHRLCLVHLHVSVILGHYIFNSHSLIHSSNIHGTSNHLSRICLSLFSVSLPNRLDSKTQSIHLYILLCHSRPQAASFSLIQIFLSSFLNLLILISLTISISFATIPFPFFTLRCFSSCVIFT